MLLGIYMGTSIASLGVITTIFHSITRHLKKRGYEFTNKSTSIGDKLRYAFYITILSLVPVFNVIAAVSLIASGVYLYDYVEKRMLELNLIYIPRENDHTDDISKEETKEETHEETIEETHEEIRSNRMNMADELKREKEEILRQREEILNGEEKEEDGPSLKRKK